MNKRIGILLPALLFLTFAASGQSSVRSQETSPENTGETSPVAGEPIEIGEVSVSALRSLASIGIRGTRLDTLATRDNISKNLADVLMQGSSIFIKSFGRGTLSTASFRGTAPSHTRVTWNGMELNSPMLGMVDLSLVPSYFIDEVTLLHGASSTGVAGGGLGGAVVLGNRAPSGRGFEMSYTQGVGSFHTFDQFLRLGYGGGRFRASTRAFYVTSRNDYRYRSPQKVWHYNEADEIVGWHHPIQRNRNGAFGDLHVQQEFYYTLRNGDRLSLAAWWMLSQRGIAMLTTDYRPENRSRAEQNEQTVRAVAGWQRDRDDYKLYARAGYVRTDLAYLELFDTGAQTLTEKINSESVVNTAFGKFGGDHYIGEEWHFAAEVTAYGHFVDGYDKAVLLPDGTKGRDDPVRSRGEVSLLASVGWRPLPRLGFAANIREELHGEQFSPVLPALFAEYIVSKKGNITLKASLARNFRYPTLNDLYFVPGGNPDLKPERGFTLDGGASFGEKTARTEYGGEVSAYSSRIEDWILWRGVGGYWSPVNIALVHSYGIEARGRFRISLGRQWRLLLDANYTLSKAVNRGDPVGRNDESVGKQLLYIPEHSASFTAGVGWRAWSLVWKGVFYSRRFTTTDNDITSRSSSVDPYFMNDISLEKTLTLGWARLNLKLSVNNLFDRDYITVLSRPMPGRNFGFFIEITPKFKHRN